MIYFSEIFTHGAVLQQGKKLNVWGGSDCASDCTVTVKLGDKMVEAKVFHDGSWTAEFDGFDYGGPYELSAEYGNDKIVCGDVYIGEVFVAGGQSNMEFKLGGDFSIEDEYENLDFPLIRYYNVPRIAHADDIGRHRKESWRQVDKTAREGMTAAGYFFAKQLHLKLNVPVGIIDCTWGGTSASCWVNEDDLKSGRNLNSYLEDFARLKESKPPHILEKELEDYRKSVQDYNDKYKEGAAKGLAGKELDEFTGPYPWFNPLASFREMSPNMLYKTMFKRVVAGYSAAGVIFYQGESDVYKAGIYGELFSKLIKRWRYDLGERDLPFLFVQITGYGCDGDWALLREQQYLTSQRMKNVYQAVIIDCGDEFDIHPRNKKTVGERLALLALRNLYGKNIKCNPPSLSGSVVKIPEGYKLYFKDTYGGLSLRNGGKGFEFVSADEKVCAASAEVCGNSLILRCDECENPLFIRYAWKNFPEYSLYNSENLTASPFRLKV